MTGQITEHWVYVGDRRIFRGLQVALHIEPEVATRIDAAAKVAEVAEVTWIVRAIRTALDREMPPDPMAHAAALVAAIHAKTADTTEAEVLAAVDAAETGTSSRSYQFDAILGPAAA